MVHTRNSQNVGENGLSEMATPKQTDPQFKLRLPANLKDRVEEAAGANNRSMNAEIVARLESSFERHPAAEDLAQAWEVAEDLRQQLKSRLDHINDVVRDYEARYENLTNELQERREKRMDHIERMAALREENLKLRLERELDRTRKRLETDRRDLDERLKRVTERESRLDEIIQQNEEREVRLIEALKRVGAREDRSAG